MTRPRARGGAARADGTSRPEVGGRGPYGRVMRPVGSEYAGKDGEAMVKVAEWPSRPGSKDNWVLKKRLVWERANGRPVRPGHVLMYGVPGVCEAANLVEVRRGTMQRLNWMRSRGEVDWHDAEGLRAAAALVELRDRAFSREREMPRTCASCGKAFVPDRAAKSGSTNLRNCRACLEAGRKACRGRGL